MYINERRVSKKSHTRTLTRIRWIFAGLVSLGRRGFLHIETICLIRRVEKLSFACIMYKYQARVNEVHIKPHPTGESLSFFSCHPGLVPHTNVLSANDVFHSFSLYLCGPCGSKPGMYMKYTVGEKLDLWRFTGYVGVGGAQHATKYSN